MSSLPWSINIANKPRLYALRYGLTLMFAYAFSTFAFGGYIPNGVWWGVGVILAVILLIFWMVRYDRSRKRRIEISESGIREIRGNREISILWSEYHQTYFDRVEVRKYGVPITTVIKTQVVAQGKHIGIEYPQVEFHDQIAVLSEAKVLPQLRDRLKKGVNLYFGPLELGELFILVNGREIRRDHINQAKVAEGKLVLKVHDDWFATRIMIRDIPNFSSFLRLLSDGPHAVRISGGLT